MYLPVALRKESVDRNVDNALYDVQSGVALRKESVDRNQQDMSSVTLHYASLSARRAWIEIWVCSAGCVCLKVALRKESVDRNAM